MDQQLRKKLEDQGYAYLEKYLPGLTSIEVASEIGQIAHLPNVESYQQLTPMQASDPNTYSGNYGLGCFPLHSDLAHWHQPPRFLLLRCITGSSEVSTRVVDSGHIISEVGELKLHRALAIPRRPAFNNNYLLRLLSKTSFGTTIFRWDELFIKPMNKDSSSVFEEILKLLKVVSCNDFYLESYGDTLVIDNWRMLHGRSAVNNNSISRHIERVYLKEVN